jgi:S-adenosylmethionine hydrolase
LKAIITLTTDFGTKDHYVGAMKGVILGINPNASVIDITHEIEKYNVTEAALKLSNFYSYFPEGTVHVVVVDPGVGGSRKPLALESNGHYFIGPDNGVFSLILRQNEAAGVFEISNPDYMLDNVSGTFHGRDIFAPASAHIALGARPQDMGSAVSDPILLDFPEPEVSGGEITGMVIYADSFGNLVTNIPSKLIAPGSKVIVGRFTIDRVSNSYADVREGEIVALVGSSGLLEISVNQGSASEVVNIENPDVIVKPL